MFIDWRCTGCIFGPTCKTGAFRKKKEWEGLSRPLTATERAAKEMMIGGRRRFSGLFYAVFAFSCISLLFCSRPSVPVSVLTTGHYKVKHVGRENGTPHHLVAVGTKKGTRAESLARKSSHNKYDHLRSLSLSFSSFLLLPFFFCFFFVWLDILDVFPSPRVERVVTKIRRPIRRSVRVTPAHHLSNVFHGANFFIDSSHI